MNVSRELGGRMNALGHTCRHVGDIGLALASDVKIVATARANAETIVTHDLDYGHLLAFSGEARPSVVVLRLRNTHPKNLCARISGAWQEIEAPLLRGAIVTIEDATVRIRALPITQER
jgi:predicted nuclease of predicted toxin-antitoxin system